MSDNNRKFWELLEPIHRPAETFCRVLAGNKDDGDDLYQEAVCRALPRLDQLRDPDSFRPWLYRIIINCHRSRTATPWWQRIVRLKPEHEIATRSDHVAGPIHARLRLAMAMKPLSTQDRALVLLFDIDGWSVPELAELAGVSQDSLRARLSRARKKMKRTLIKYTNSRPGLNRYESFEQESDVCVASKRRPE